MDDSLLILGSSSGVCLVALQTFYTKRISFLLLTFVVAGRPVLAGNWDCHISKIWKIKKKIVLWKRSWSLHYTCYERGWSFNPEASNKQQLVIAWRILWNLLLSDCARHQKNLSSPPNRRVISLSLRAPTPGYLPRLFTYSIPAITAYITTCVWLRHRESLTPEWGNTTSFYRSLKIWVFIPISFSSFSDFLEAYWLTHAVILHEV